MEKRACKKGEQLAVEGEPCENLIIIYEGEFERSKKVLTQIAENPLNILLPSTCVRKKIV